MVNSEPMVTDLISFVRMVFPAGAMPVVGRKYARFP